MEEKFQQLLKKERSLLGAGGLFYCPTTDRYLVSHRSNEVDEPNTWATWGGKIEHSESPEEALRREVKEESGYDGQYDLKLVHSTHEDNVQFYYFILTVPAEFVPTLSPRETQGFRWVKLDSIPTPTHFGLKDLVEHLKKK
jgi:8-oxo-dGTP pyrophosphatase MutT (NUDIX family)